MTIPSANDFPLDRDMRNDAAVVAEIHRLHALLLRDKAIINDLINHAVFFLQHWDQADEDPYQLAHELRQAIKRAHIGINP